MKIAIIYDALYPEVIGGGEKRNWEVARRLVKRGHEVWLVSMQYWEGPAVLEREGVKCAGVAPAVPLFSKGGGRSFTEPFYFAKHLYRFLKKHQFDVLELGSFPYLSCFAARIACRKSETPQVITWYEIRGLKGWMQYAGMSGIIAWFFEVFTTRLSPFNTVISPLTDERCRRIYPGLSRRIQLIPCGVAADAPRRMPAVRRSRMLSMGRLVSHKRVEWALEAVARLQPSCPDIHLTVIGRGPHEKALRSLVAERGISDAVDFRGFVSTEELAAIRQQSDLFLFPSEQEGFGLVMIEAMAGGIPVVAADAPLSAARTIIDHGRNGLLARSEDEFIAHIGTLLGNQELYEDIVEQGYRTAQQYDWDKVIVPELESYIKDCIKDLHHDE